MTSSFLAGLQLVLDIEQNEYLPHLTDAAGVRIVVHPQERMPFPQDEGIVAAPATLTSIGIRQVDSTALQSNLFLVIEPLMFTFGYS